MLIARSKGSRRVAFVDGRGRLARWTAKLLTPFFLLFELLWNRRRKAPVTLANTVTNKNFRRKKPIRDRLRGLMTKNERIRQQTLEWVRINLPYMRVYNYTTSWSDGLTLCFLLQSINPQLCTNATCLKPQNKLQNCELALRVIRDFFQIDTDNIITAEEMVAEHEPDKVLDLILAVRQANESKLKTAFESKRGSLSSMMKRVSFALSLSLKRSNSVQPNDSSPEISDLCTARGSGLHHSIIGRPSAFLVSVPEIKLQRVLVEIRSANGDQSSHFVSKQEDEADVRSCNITIYSEFIDSHQARVQYILESLCDHHISVSCNDKYMTESPFLVKVTPPVPNVQPSSRSKAGNPVSMSIEQWRIEKTMRIDAFRDVETFYNQRRSTDQDAKGQDASARTNSAQPNCWSVVSRRVLQRRTAKKPKLAFVAESLLSSRAPSIRTVAETPTQSCSPERAPSLRSPISCDKEENESNDKSPVLSFLPPILSTLVPPLNVQKPSSDFSQQVHYEEIKKETGWSRPRGVATAIRDGRKYRPTIIVPETIAIDTSITQSDNKAQIARHLKIFGSGLHFGAVNVDNTFQISSTKSPLEASENVISVKIDGPDEDAVRKVNISNLEDDNHVVQVSYQVTKVGFYSITVTYCGFPLANGPFVCKVTE